MRDFVNGIDGTLMDLSHFKGHAMGGFLECMAGAAQSVHDYFKQPGKNIVYINVLNDLSIDCDCDGRGTAPVIGDIGIMASLDLVALDQAGLDMVFNYQPKEGDNKEALINRIKSLHGTHTVDYAEKIGLGTKQYNLIELNNTSPADL